MFKKSGAILAFVLGGFILMAVASTGCNNEAKKTSTDTDTTINKDTIPPIDTTVMDTGTVRPIKTPT